jgi:hypothetical protein
MPRKRMRKRTKQSENESYEFEVEGWKVDYSFGVNIGRHIYPGDYREHSSVIINAKLLSPILKSSTEANIHLIESSEVDDHWKQTATGQPKGIGHIELLRDNSLFAYCHIPSHQFLNLSTALASDKIKYAKIFGTKLKWRSGTVIYIDLSTDREEE